MVHSLRLPAERGRPLRFTFEGASVDSYEGETLATALLAAQVTAFGHTREGNPRLPFCNMGTCFDCAVEVDGRGLVRACLTDVTDGMIVRRQEIK